MSSKEIYIPGGSSMHSVTTSFSKNHSLKDSFEADDKSLSTPTSGTSSSADSINVISDEKNMIENRHANRCCSEVLITDLLCTVCKQLLYRPVVLNCGHGNKLVILNPSQLTY